MEEFFEQKFSQLSALKKGDYDSCSFTQCDLPSADLSGFRFLNCEFDSCNLSNVQLNNTAFQEVYFKQCKMLGLRFGDCKVFGFEISATDCPLNHSSFFEVNLRKTRFKACQLHEVDFTGADLHEASFDGCDLLHANFEQSNLEHADFRTAINYQIDPDLNKLKNARFSADGLAGLLSKYGIDIS